MAVQIFLRRGTAAEWAAADPILAQGEFGYETDTGKLKLGDGSTSWTSLASVIISSYIPTSTITARGQIITGSDVTDYDVLSIGTVGQVIVEDPVNGTLSYQDLSLSGVFNFDTSGTPTGDLLSYGASSWDSQSFATAVSADPDFLRSVIADGDSRIGSAGYFSRGGNNPTNTVYKWYFPGDTVSTTTSAPDPMMDHAGFANPSVAGYFSMGGSQTLVFKWAFPTDTATTTSHSPSGMYNHAGFANPAVAGYFSRGYFDTAVYKWSFPTDAVSTTTAATNELWLHAGFANPAVAGYFSRGDGTNTVYKWTFPADTVSTTTNALDPMRSHAGFANPSVAGYFSQGTFGSQVFKWSFPSDAVSYVTFFSPALTEHAGFSNPYVAGYFSRGGGSEFVHKLAFPTDAVSTTTSAPNNMRYHAGFANA